MSNNNTNVFNLVDLQDAHDQRAIEDDARLTPNFNDHVPVATDTRPTPEVRPLTAPTVRYNNTRCPAKDLRLLDFALVKYVAEKLLIKQFGAIPEYPSTDCWVLKDTTPGVLINGNHGDYPYVSLDGKRYLATHVMKLLFQLQTIWDEENGDFKFCPGVDRSKVDASHLCHKPFCVNPDHVIFESAAKNISRNYCLRRFKCRGHPGSPNCIFTVDPVPADAPEMVSSFKINGKALKVIFKYRINVAESKKNKH